MQEYEPNSALRLQGDFLSEDFCLLDGQHYMVRAILPIPVIGLKDAFAFGCWSTLSRPNFDKYVDGFDSGEFADMGPWSGWLMNRLTGFNDEAVADALAVHVQPQIGRQRPKLFVMDDTHPLAIAQNEGVSPTRILELFTHYGHVPVSWKSH